MKVLRVVGKFLISVGCGFLLFVGWTLWGTGFYTSAQQDRLEREIEATLSVAGPNEGGSDKRLLPPDGFRPRPGEAVFRLEIPAIDVRHIVVEGVDTDDLRLGPGHYPTCRDGFDLCIDNFRNEAWPGERERVIVSGHRTTYGAPFWDLDKIERGDEVRVEAKWGRFVYTVRRTEIVDDESTAIVIPGRRAEIVLTTCNPKFSAAQRLVVFAELEEATA